MSTKTAGAAEAAARMHSPARPAARRWYLAGSIAWILTGIAHLVGQFAGGDDDLALRAVRAMMHGYAVDRSVDLDLWDVLQNWGVYFGALCLFVGALGLAVLRASRGERAILRSIAGVNFVGALVMSMIAGYYRFPPPILCFVVTMGCFGISSRIAARE